MSYKIYAIECEPTNKHYIGMTGKNWLSRRKSQHIYMLSRDQHKNGRLQKDWNKYGRENFSWIKLEEFEDQQEAENAESFYISFLKTMNKDSGYNMTSGGISGHTRSRETVEKVAEGNRGRVVSDETRRKISKAKMGHTLSEEHKKKLHKAASKSLEIPRLQYDLDGNFIKEYSCGNEIIDEFNIYSSNLSKCCKGERLGVKGYMYRYKPEGDYPKKITSRKELMKLDKEERPNFVQKELDDSLERQREQMKKQRMDNSN